MYQWLHTARPGTLDTSLISSDNINNPRTMNAIYNLGRTDSAQQRWGKETLTGGQLNNKQFNDYDHLQEWAARRSCFQKPDTVFTPRILKDGSDSVGVPGSTQPCLHQHRPVQRGVVAPLQAGRRRQADHAHRDRRRRKNSNCLEGDGSADTGHGAVLLVRAGGRPDRLKDAPGGAAYLTKDKAELNRGKAVFAERCARCHSSKIPTPAPGVDPGGCSGPGYLACWNKYWDWTKTDEFKKQMKDIVLADDFLDGNYLSTELRACPSPC